MYQPPSSHAAQQKGFTLVELAIVLVIIGLIVGGVLTGNSLIRAAELRAIEREFATFRAATYTFKTRFNGYPGDLRKATQFWGELSTCPSGPPDGLKTCNGNGDRRISETQPEAFRFWQHLSNAELVGGAFTGVPGPGSLSHAILDENVPSSRIGGAGWSFGESGYPGNVGDLWNRPEVANTWILGAENQPWAAGAGIMTGAEIAMLDNKMDDGKPGRGKVQTQKFCTDTNDNLAFRTAQYRMDDGRLCPVYFLKVF